MKKVFLGVFVAIVFLVFACTKDSSIAKSDVDNDLSHEVEGRSDAITGSCAEFYTEGKDCTQTPITMSITLPSGCQVTVQFVRYFCTDGTRFFSEPRLTGIDFNNPACWALMEALKPSNYLTHAEFLAFYVSWKQELNHAVVTAYMSQWNITTAPPWFNGDLWTVEIVESTCYALCDTGAPLNPIKEAPCGFGCCKVSYNYNTNAKTVGPIYYEQLNDDGECGGVDEPCLGVGLEIGECVMKECGS